MSDMHKTLLAFIALATVAFAEAQKNILIIYGKSSHANYCHNNKEVGLMLEKKLAEGSNEGKFKITSVFNYPEDLSLVENADLIIISSDGGKGHALANAADPTKNTTHLDGVLKKNKTGLIVIHWATDAPSTGFGKLHPENSTMMINWIGACYYWDKKSPKPNSSWTWKYPVFDLKVNQSHPVSNGVPANFKLQDEYYFNFFTEGADSRTPKTDRVTFLHTAMAPNHAKDQKNPETFREQAVYWAFEREDTGRSIAMTSAHMYHSWANPHFFKTFANSVLWTLNMEVPENGSDIVPPTFEELVSVTCLLYTSPSPRDA